MRRVAGMLSWEVMHEAVPFHGHTAIASIVYATNSKRPMCDAPAKVCVEGAALIKRLWDQDPSMRPPMRVAVQELQKLPSYTSIRSEVESGRVGV